MILDVTYIFVGIVLLNVALFYFACARNFG